MDLQRFYAGACFDAYRYLGGHMEAEGGVFRTFAPSAAGVSLLAEWEDWQERPMERVLDGNFWEARSPGAVPGQRYKYRIWKRDGSFLDHCDPYGFWMEKRPHTASVLCGPEQDYIFCDQAWMAARTTCQDRPLHIYEVHAGSWKKPGPGPEDWYDWDQLGELLLPYVQELGCNYIEFLPLSEHPSDASWGYQNTGFFSPTSRYGSPRQLKAFVDRCHQEGVGVLLDFVPVHFAVDDYALWQYDGTALYEYPHSDVGVSEWGSCNFMHSVSRLIYWQGDPARGENQNGLAFLRGMNLGLKALHPTAILAAEDSTAWPGVTAPAQEGGLGFDYKWDIGWMHDTLTYFQSPPHQRPGKYHQLTFSMDYFYNERYLLPLSHDEGVHGKATIAQKMYGEYEGKFPQARALYLYMMAHPGKKLNFMGFELAQLREWDERRQQDWELLRYPVHDGFAHFIQALNHLYLESPALWQQDYSREGFRWLACEPGPACLYAWERRGGGQRLGMPRRRGRCKSPGLRGSPACSPPRRRALVEKSPLCHRSSCPRQGHSQWPWRPTPASCGWWRRGLVHNEKRGCRGCGSPFSLFVDATGRKGLLVAAFLRFQELLLADRPQPTSPSQARQKSPTVGKRRLGLGSMALQRAS